MRVVAPEHPPSPPTPCQVARGQGQLRETTATSRASPLLQPRSLRRRFPGAGLPGAVKETCIWFECFHPDQLLTLTMCSWAPD